ncbi:RNA polymerase subunit sigma [Clostridium baratii]|uniref:RNA polymerase subunit sigma n=1 Tax=Clostridium baratii TaxID=1561 RepID=UPI0022E2DB9B|nr:RNA polymerase subunit sigma [Clostridium baratii]
MIRKLKIGEEELEFKITNRTIFNIDEKYNNYGDVINGLMEGVQLYNNSLKILCSSCISRRLQIEEVIEKLTPMQVSYELVDFVTQLYLDYMGVKEKSEKNEVKEEKEDKKKA